MRVSSTFIIAACALLANSSAAAVTNSTELVITQTSTVGNYTLTVWSDAPGASNPGVDRRCGSNEVTCSSTFTAASSLCYILIQELYGSTTILANSPRSICLEQVGSQCCVSWSAAVGDMAEEDLYSAAIETLDTCSSSSETVSGYAVDVNLQGHCVHQCLSNRPTGC